MIQNQPKSIDDYKDVVKILKLKIIKQNKRIQELELKNKNFEEQLNSVTIRGDDINISSRVMAELENEASEKKQQKELELDTLKGKVEVMGLFVRGLKKMGITPEAVFRVADFAYKNYVEADYFREILGKMRLGLSQKEISCLIFIFDESCSGFITRDDFTHSLNAYKVGLEAPHHPFVQDSAFKLAQMLHTDKVSLQKFYEQMEGKSKSKLPPTKKAIDLNVFEEQLKKYYPGRISDRQIVAAFNAIDLQSVGYLEKNNFLYCITSCINKLLTADEGLSRKSQLDWNNNGRSQYHQQDPIDTVKTTPKKFQKAIQNQNDQSKVLPYTPTDSSLDRLQADHKLNLFAIYEQLLLDPLSSRLTLKSFKKHLLALNSNLPHPLLSDLFKQIDTYTRGSLYFNELLNFYLANANDNEITLRILGKYLYREDLDAQKFWHMFGFSADAEISKGKFLQIMGKTFESKNEKVWENLWSVFDKGRGSCNIGLIIRTLKKYELQ